MMDNKREITAIRVEGNISGSTEKKKMNLADDQKLDRKGSGDDDHRSANKKMNNHDNGGDGRRTSSSSSLSGMAKRLVMEDVDKVADEFIKKFRNQLKIEREESFKRFQEMIDRGL